MSEDLAALVELVRQAERGARVCASRREGVAAAALRRAAWLLESVRTLLEAAE